MEHNDLHKFQLDLIEDSKFIAWVKSDFVEHDDHWSAYVDDNMDRMDDINAAIHFVSNIEFAESPVLDANKLWERIEADTKADKKDANIISLINWKYLAGFVAAACMIFVVFFRPSVTDQSTSQTYSADVAQKTTEAFPDGSAITLNPNSRATFDASKWEESRKVHLTGMAFFEVRKGSKFVVETANGSVTVLGTSFSVDARNDNFQVICKTGKVSIKSKKGEEKVLSSGDVATMTNEHLFVQSLPKGTVSLISWLDGGFTFSNEEFGDVVSEIESQFDVKVIMADSLKSMKYTGFFKNKDLNDALFSVTWPMKLKYKIEGKSVILSEE